MVKRTVFSRFDFGFRLVLAPWCPPHSASCSSHTNSLSLWWSPHPLTFSGQLISNVFGLLSTSWGPRWLVLALCKRTVLSFLKKSFIYTLCVCVFLGQFFLKWSPIFFSLSLPIHAHAGPDESQAGIKMGRRNIQNLRYADDTTLMAERKEKLKGLLMKVKEESEKVGLINTQKTEHGIWSHHFMANR